MANTLTTVRGIHDPKARLKLTEKREPKEGRTLYPAQLITDRLHLLYRRRVETDRRKPEPNGVWVVRRFDPDSGKKFPYTVETIGTANDLEPANGRTVLTFEQARDKAIEMSKAVVVPDEVLVTTTVGHVVQKYVERRDARDVKRQGREVRSDASRRMGRYVLGQPKRGKSAAIPPAPIAAVRIPDITKEHLRAWLASLPPEMAASSVERLCSDLKAALNGWYEKNYDKVSFNLTTMLAKELKQEDQDGEDAGVARENQILSNEQLARVLAAAKAVDAQGDWGGDLERIIRVLAQTGARFSQVVRLRVRDCQPEHGRLMVPNSRKGKNKRAQMIPTPIPDDLMAMLRPMMANRAADASLLERWLVKQTGPAEWKRIGRGAWKASSELTRPWKRIREIAGLPDEIVTYSLRHTAIVRAIRADIPLRVVAALNDTSTAVIEAHYSAFIASGLEELVRDRMQSLPTLPTDDNVVPIRGQA